MCGINGFIDFKVPDSPKVKRRISIMNDQIIHRGPDDHGHFVEISKQYSIAMGMRRLSIIDLQSGEQPIYSDDGNLVIVFNGEIYNYIELRNELLDEGTKFKTKSDTEVILRLYEKYNIAGFKKLDGMFAFSLYDKERKKVFIGRDYFGEKPLYFTQKNGTIIWASELKSLLKGGTFQYPICKKGLNLFFRLTYIPAPFTIYEGIHKLNANHLLEIDLTAKTINQQKIIPSKNIEPYEGSFEMAKSGVRELVTDSVESRSVSDVPIGTFLSGGVDSSIVSLCLSRMSDRKINTFSIGFEQRGFDERDKSRVVAKIIESNHHEFVLNEKDLESNVHNILMNFDEPFADSSALPSYLVAHQTSKHVKVALTGDGGDEMFGGYNKYYMGSINQKYINTIPKTIHKAALKSVLPLLRTTSDKRGFRFKAKRLLHAIDYSGSYYWDIISLGFSANTLQPYLNADFYEPDIFDYYRRITGISCPSNLQEYREVDRNISLEGDMLVKVDRTSMMNSLECRAPFLNKKIWDYTSSLPDKFLLKGWDKKYILKKAFEDDFPQDFLNKSKAGFGLPIGDWLRSSLKQELVSYIDASILKSQGIFDIGNITSLVQQHLNGKDHTFQVWSFYCFQKWYYKAKLD